jgi:DNA-binding transcriptional LysR family regulator
MDHTQLRLFVASARHLHFAHAARELGVTRASVVASVRLLEEQLGYPLFDTTASSTTLTAEGEAFLVDAQRQLDASAKAAAKNVAAPGGKAKASKGKGRAPAVKGERKKPGGKRTGR